MFLQQFLLVDPKKKKKSIDYNIFPLSEENILGVLFEPYYLQMIKQKFYQFSENLDQ